MKKLPILEKNAYLNIYISSNSISANLSYSHYDIGRNYILHDDTYFDPVNDPISDQSFWDEYFVELMRLFEWKILELTKTKISFAQIIDFEDEGLGVSGISFVLHNALPNRIKILSVLHSYLPTAEIIIHNDKEISKFAPELTQKLGYKSLLYINADFEKFDVINIDTVNENGKPSEKVTSAKIYWDNKESLIQSIFDKKFNAFMSVDMNIEENINLWANFVTRSTFTTENYILHDVLRAFLTVELSTILFKNPEITECNLVSEKDRLVVVEGVLTKLLDIKEIVIALLDGLQMKGPFDLFIDKNSQFISYGRKFTEGINAKDYIVPVSAVLGDLNFVSIIENPSKKSNEAVFSGEFVSKESDRKDVYLLSSEFREFKFANDESKSIFSGRCMKGAYIYGLDKNKELIIVSDPENVKYKSVFLDARMRPVIYGPDYRKNKDKLKMWTNE